MSTMSTMNATVSDKVLLRWQENFNVGIDGIDEQHRKLLDLINGLWNATVRGASAVELLAHVDELERYTGYHFSDEEQAMQAARYPQLAEHCKAHRAFVQRIASEKQKVCRDGYVTLDLVRFLQDWLLQHIAVQDKHYASFVSESGERLTFFTRLLRRFA